MKPSLFPDYRCSLTPGASKAGRFVVPPLGGGACDQAKAGTTNRGFTLLEIMVVVSLLTVIVYGLYAMFDRTQRALRANTSQVDILESGRAALDVLSRELEQVVASDLPDTNLIAPHLYARLDYTTNVLTQTLVDGSTRTNLLQSCFFVTRPNGQWLANGFFVATTTNTSIGPVPTLQEVHNTGVGTLYRFVYPPPPNPSGVFRLTIPELRNWTNQYQTTKTGNNFTNAITTVFPLTDGVVHFRIRPYDAHSILITNSFYFYTYNNRLFTNLFNATFPFERIANRISPERQFYFHSNSMPSFLELELGIIDPQVLQRIKGMPLSAQRNYLANQVGAVHLFHKYIPLRNAQP